MRILWFLVFLAIYGGLSLLLGWGIRSWLAALGVFRWEPLYWAVYAIIVASPVVGRLNRALRFLAVVGNYYFFVFEYGLLFGGVGALLVWLTPLDVAAAGWIVLAVLVVLAVIGTAGAFSPMRRQLVLHVAKPGRSLRIAVASDLHLGMLSGTRHLQKFVAAANAVRPDLVLLAGDLIDDDPGWYIRKNMGAILGGLRARHGVYGILGNHEYYGGELEKIVAELAKANVRILRDETVQVDGWLKLTGREDVTNRERKTLEVLAREAGVDAKTEPWIVMNHTPDDLKTPAELGVDLHVSGHTHKGQLWPNQWITRRIFELDHGYKQKQDMHAVVSSGYGFWGPPFRVGSRSEWWDIELRFLPVQKMERDSADFAVAERDGVKPEAGEAVNMAGSVREEKESVSAERSSATAEDGISSTAAAVRTAGAQSAGTRMAGARTAVVAGATGLVGRELVRQLLEDGAYASVVALVRRKTGLTHPKLQEVVVDYRALVEMAGETVEEEQAGEPHIELRLAGADVFCALGTTIKKAGTQEAFRKVDYDYPLALGRLAKAQGAAQFLIVTAMGADPASRIFYSRVKGEVEEALRDLHLPVLHLFRPSLLLGKRDEFRLGERLAGMIMPGFAALLGKYRPVHGRTVAAAMIRMAKSGEPGVHIHESNRIREIGAVHTRQRN